MNKDNKFPFMDLTKFLDEVFGQVEGFSEKLQTEMERTFQAHGPWSVGKIPTDLGPWACAGAISPGFSAGSASRL